MQRWEYKVAYVDFHGRISVEGQELHIAQEHKTTFVRRFLDSIGNEGWELVGVQPLSPHSAYYVLKRASDGVGTEGQAGTSGEHI